MKRILSFICLLSFGVSPILSLTTAVRPTTAQTYSTSAFCRDHQQIYAFTQWTKLLGQLDSETLTQADITQLLNLLRTSGKTPQTIQLTIDRLTLVRDLQKPPLLLDLIERTPIQQRSQFLPVIDELVTLAAALPPGYNYAQSRALITSAQAYTQLNQPLRSTPILLQANRTLAGITVPTLKAETQWRLAEAWFGMGQKLTGQANLAATTATLSTLSPQSRPLNNNLPTVLVDSYLGLGQWSEAEAAARAIPIFTQQTEQLFRIATAYQKAGQVQPASTLFNQTINSILRTAPNQKDLIEIATDGMISFAQAGGIITAAEAAKQLPDNQPALRAKAWLAIAGEARQQNRPQEAAFALEQLIAAGKIGQQQGFGSGFGRLRDREWSGVLYALSRSEDYIPEMLQFIEELNLETEAAEFLIAEAVQSQRFEEAQQLIPRPMPLVIDVGVFKVEDSWDWWVASVAAAEGKPEQLIALSEEILSQIGTTEPEELSAWRIPTSPDITYPSSDRPPLFLPDIRPAESLPEERAIYAIKLLQDQGETKLAEKLSKALAEQAEDLLKSKSNVKLYADQHPIQWVHHLERYLRLQQQTKVADRLYRLQVKYLKRIKDS
ncbi:MAG: hypothetical protein SWJ54_21055, partial [Cyanobacteriota bacterium]|nr:hypothetical protein [Cyanobacteriota bacterium]